MVEIELNRVGEGYHLIATNQEGNEVHMDASPDIGGTQKGMRPMQVLLSSLAGCSTIDVINILKKQKQQVESVNVRVQGDRSEGEVPSPFRKVHLEFILSGAIDPIKLDKAISLSVEKYCSVLATLNKEILITYSGRVKEE